MDFMLENPRFKHFLNKVVEISHILGEIVNDAKILKEINVTESNRLTLQIMSKSLKFT